ncbi:helix-turn-helix transcriptional regulator [Mycobacterium sp. CBMA293]|uniref:winged helix-turn-helix transcriptional regulator n=1 Tax=unclassified Mycolicibacterium TaxID=2636767 RepID=UPI0012DF0F35|nr:MULTISPECIES: helix-turn-helix domain-containing protein [unclassified Mycolicibacterium]MUL44751.1 helix-turn-helix transcriptional regulator [Mycolicibacterium sp. CBMA 360]MUL58141.1 helix-turn-helix transcriptional regulator [Mycolicibacterium sp. CBMA 335]MUL73599.1 helix-turn-helix transcriptional regulator [Mycolicibacterium sp. CBMA 311]MUL93024.1 helix-turn-helix transcriptional regulator [Mycolicibacterium sp. CBMA 230]MUM07573.1 transcriptional regulator [Mycolicibacterium sp. CB
MEFEERLRDRQWSIGEGCSVAKLLDLLSTKTVFLAVRESLFGTTRFEDFVDRIGTSAPAVSRALKQLEAAQLMVRMPYQEPGKRVRDEYRLTAAGEDLLPVYLAMSQWGDKHLQNGRGPLTFVDRESGKRLGVIVTDDSEAASVGVDDIEIRVNRSVSESATTTSSLEMK